jgi:hypothetical protein
VHMYARRMTSSVPTRPRAVCLFGNGLSIAYNPALSVESLTARLLEDMSRLAGSKAADALSRFAVDLRGTESPQLEDLLGPLDSMANALPDLTGLKELATSEDKSLVSCINTVGAFTRDVYRVGVAVVLRAIAELGIEASPGSFDDTVRLVCERLLEAEFDEPLTIGTLNYDGLLTAALLDLGGPRKILSDMGHGAYEALRRVSESRKDESRCWPVRRTDDFIRRVHLIHLHGSLAWLRDPEGDVWKFELDELRTDRGWPSPLWDDLIEDRTDLTPSVVLTDQKGPATQVWPFSLAYAVFEHRLIESERWLIAGYSFGDKPLNETLRRAHGMRAIKKTRPPKLLVIDLGDADRIRATVETAIGRAPDLIDGSGLPEATDAAAFHEWIA